MSETAVLEWLLRTLLGGGLVLLAARLVMSRLVAPARRQRLGEWAMLAAVLLAFLSLAPAWLLLPLPTPGSTALPANLLPRGEASPALAGSRADSREAEPRQPSVPRQSLGTRGTRGEQVVAAPWMEGNELSPDNALADELILPAQAEPPLAGVENATRTEASTRTPFASRLLFAVAGLYLAGVSLLLAHGLLGHLVLALWLRRAEPVPSRLTRLFAAMPERRPRDRVLLSARVRVPFSCGLWRPTVVLPSALAAQAGADVLRWIFAHELRHLRQGDAWSRMLFALGQALYFPLPWFWQLRRQVSLCQEYLADAAAATLGGREDYAQFLLGFAAAPAAPLGLTGVSGTNSDLFRRVTMLLHAPTPLEPRCSRRWSLLTAAGLLALAVFVAGVGLAAHGAPAALTDDTKKDETKKDEPKKEDAKKDVSKSDEPKKGDATKDEAKKTDTDKEIDELVELWLKSLPKAANERQAKERRENLDRRVRDMPAAQRTILRRTLEQGRMVPVPPGLGVVGVGAPPGVPGGPGGFPGGPPGAMWGQRQLRLGIRVEPPSTTLAEQLDLPKGQGLVVQEVLPDTAADKAGFKRHDVLLELNGKAVSNRIDELTRLVSDIKADKAVEAVVLRKGKKETIKDLKLPAERAGGPGRPGGFVPPGGAGGAGGFVPPGGAGGAGGFPPGAFPGQFMPPGAGGPGAVVTTLIRTGDRLNVQHREGILHITLTGKVDDGKAKISTIQIQEGAPPERYESVDKVPQRHRDKVKKLVEMTEKGSLFFESKAKE
jgi:beta-lactamase regulating signal transducer with metallopeptidase domain